uniref:Uncharacterized protein n=1 Tax=Hucho hucho TaxID=62062 RepID=A0A4W5KDJ8_9TELE
MAPQLLPLLSLVSTLYLVAQGQEQPQPMQEEPITVSKYCGLAYLTLMFLTSINACSLTGPTSRVCLGKEGRNSIDLGSRVLNSKRI